MLATVIFMMSAATFTIGLIPTYATIGIAAPCILIALRLVQGFLAGGESTGAAAHLAEYADPRRRARIMTVWQIASFIGVFTATSSVSTIVAVVGRDAATNGGWRILFMLAGLLGIFGLYLRNKLPETPEYAKLKASGEVSRTPLREAFALHKREKLIVAGLAMTSDSTSPWSISPRS